MALYLVFFLLVKVFEATFTFLGEKRPKNNRIAAISRFYSKLLVGGVAA